MIEAFKRVVRRHWPDLRLGTILLLTFVFVAALPGVGALFLRVYENTLVRQTEAELIAQDAALAAAAANVWPGGQLTVPAGYAPEPPGIDLRTATILPDRPPARMVAIAVAPSAIAWGARLQPVLRQTTRTTLASILLLDAEGRILTGAQIGRSLADVAEVRAALRGQPATALRRNDSYRSRYAFEWLSRASNLRIHHARPVIAGGRMVGVLLLARSPRALFVGIYADRGKIVLGVVLILAALVVLSGLLSRGIVRPIEQLGEATRAVAKGGGTVPAAPNTAATEIRALYRDFGVMAEAIEQRSRYLRDFAHAMSHEFKTPLAGISGAVELLQDHPEMAAADRQRFLNNMAGDASRLTRLVSRLLELARADMADGERAVETDIATALHRLIDASRTNGLSVSLELTPDFPSVALPEAVVEAVVTALVENSRQAGAETIAINGTGDGDTATLIVSDDGPGIPLGDQARIFEPFFTSRRAAGGTGLGLPIARSLVQAHGATIELEPSATGAAFRIVMPTG